MVPTARTALRRADEIRRKFGITMFQPINIFDICQNLKVDVRFIDISMEGLYATDGNKPTILLSALRPLPRRCFTCAHELGHHIFNHGSRIDALYSNNTMEFSDDEEESLVDIFASALLMPVSAIQSQFAKRKWNINNASPLQFYTVASAFGTGYSTLITHCAIHQLINRPFADRLLKIKPASILKQIVGYNGSRSYFKIIDRHSGLNVVDLEVSNFLIIPKGSKVEGSHLEKVESTEEYEFFLSIHPGITRITDATSALNAFVRVQRENYVGLAEYRHLETKIIPNDR